MRNNIIATSLIALSALSFSTTLQADDDSGFYLGAGLHRANFDRGSVASSDTKGNLSAGYMFNNNWGIDGTFYNFIDKKENNVNLSVAGLAVTGVYMIPVTQRVDVYGKAGLIRTKFDIKENNNKVVDESGTDWVFGLGAKIDFGKHNLLLEYSKIDPKDTALDVVSLGYRYEF